MIRNTLFVLLILSTAFILVACSEKTPDDKGIGPITTVTLGNINEEMAMQGKGIFDGKCLTCHRADADGAGPKLKDITKKRTPEWIMNIILNPQEMILKNATAKKVSEKYKMHMSSYGLTEQDARAVLEYLRYEDSRK